MYANVTRLSIGQKSSTMKVEAQSGEHPLLSGSEFASLICLQNGKPVVPQYLDRWSPEKFGQQRATVTTPRGVHRGIIMDPIGGYSNLTLASDHKTLVITKNQIITYEAVAKPARVQVPDGETLTLIYNTSKISGQPTYRAYIDQGLLVRIDMMITISNNTGLALQFAKDAQLVFKVTDPNAPADGRGFREEAVVAARSAAASVSVDSAVAATKAGKTGEMMTFTLQASEIPVGESTRVIQVLSQDQIQAHRHLWYDLLDGSMVWGYQVQFRSALPRGRLFACDQSDYDTISMQNAEFPMIIPGKTARLRIAPTNDRVRLVKLLSCDDLKCHGYELPEDGDTDLKTTYLLKHNPTLSSIVPSVPLTDGYYEFNGGSRVLVEYKQK